MEEHFSTTNKHSHTRISLEHRLMYSKTTDYLDATDQFECGDPVYSGKAFWYARHTEPTRLL